MTKDFCDICNGELQARKETPLGFFSTRFEFKEIITFPMMLWSPFTGSCNSKKLDVCSKCIDDFKEFRQRKSK